MPSPCSDSEQHVSSAFLNFLRHAAAAQQNGTAQAQASWLDAAAQLHPLDNDLLDSLDSLTTASLAQHRHDDAIALAAIIAQLDPNRAVAHFRLGYTPQMANRHGEAIAPYRRALELDPRLPQLRNNLAGALMLTDGDLSEQFALLESAVQDEPGEGDAWTNLTQASRAGFNLPRAHEAGARAVQCAPHGPLAHNNYALALREAQRRDGSLELGGNRPQMPAPTWQGEPLAGKTLLVWGEQGMGDVLQFSRYIPLLAERVQREGGRLLWNSFPQMGALLVRNLGVHVDDYTAGGVESLPPFNYEIPLLSLPFIFDTWEETIPAAIPYLHADPAASESWRTRLAGEPRLKVGLTSTGSTGHQRNPFRRVDWERCAAYFGGMKDVAFYSLQPEAAADVAAAQAAGLPMTDVTAGFTDFDDTAAFVSALDLVITVCTSVAHLSGALGQRT